MISKPRPASRAGTDLLRHRHPPNPDLSLTDPRVRRIFASQPSSAALAPDPAEVALSIPFVPASRLILSSELEPDPLVVASWPSRPETAVLAFWRAPDPMELERSGPLAPTLIVSPGTDVLTFRHPPDPSDLEPNPLLLVVLPSSPGTAELEFWWPPDPSDLVLTRLFLPSATTAAPGMDVLFFWHPPDP